MADQQYTVDGDSFDRIARSVRYTESLPPPPPPVRRGIPIATIFTRIVRGKASGAIPKVTSGIGTGTVLLWGYSSALTGSVANGETLSNVNVWAVPDNYQVPDGAEVYCAYFVDQYGPGWWVVQSWPCPAHS